MRIWLSSALLKSPLIGAGPIFGQQKQFFPLVLQLCLTEISIIRVLLSLMSLRGPPNYCVRVENVTKLSFRVSISIVLSGSFPCQANFTNVAPKLALHFLCCGKKSQTVQKSLKGNFRLFLLGHRVLLRLMQEYPPSPRLLQ